MGESKYILTKEIHPDSLRKKSEKTEKRCSISTKLYAAEVTNLCLFDLSSVIISNPDASNNFDNCEPTPMDAADSQVPIEEIAAGELDSFSLRIIHSVDNETTNADKLQVPVEKIAAELDSFSLRIVKSVDNETPPDWIFSNGLYDDLINLSGKSSQISSCGSIDNCLDVFNGMELDELDEYLCH